MASGGVVIKGDGTFDGWIQGLAHFDVDTDPFKIAGDLLFDRSQSFVHIISSDLKGSGTVENDYSEQGIAVYVAYGGEDAPYALYEHARGGDHAYLTRAFQATEAELQAAVNESVDKTMGRLG